MFSKKKEAILRSNTVQKEQKLILHIYYSFNSLKSFLIANAKCLLGKFQEDIFYKLYSWWLQDSRVAMKSAEFSLHLPNPIIHNKSIFPFNVCASPNAENSIHFFINKSDLKHRKKRRKYLCAELTRKRSGKSKNTCSNLSTRHFTKIGFIFFFVI